VIVVTKYKSIVTLQVCASLGITTQFFDISACFSLIYFHTTWVGDRGNALSILSIRHAPPHQMWFTYPWGPGPVQWRYWK